MLMEFVKHTLTTCLVFVTQTQTHINKNDRVHKIEQAKELLAF